MKKRMSAATVIICLFSCSLLSAAAGEYNVCDYGAVADGKTLSTAAIQRTIDACAASGGGKVIIPPGAYLSGPIFLKSHLQLEIMAGATLLADTNISAYPGIDGRWEGIERRVYASLITGHNLENVSITGRGRLDGQGEVWWRAHHETAALRKIAGLKGREPENPPGAPLKWPRPRVINLYDCSNVLIRDLTIVNSPSWTIHPVYCENVTVENITIMQPYDSPNTDGINPESCRNVRILNCFVDCGDDCITIKSGYNQDGRRVNRPCEGIVIANCTFAHGRSAIGIGSETSGGVRDVVISNCVFRGTLRGLRVKSARGRGNVVENIRAINIVMDQVGTGISLDMFYGEKDDSLRPVDETTPHFRDIHYSHITGRGLQRAGEILGLPEAPMTGVTLSDIDLEAESGLVVKFTQDIDLHDMVINVRKGPALKISASADVGIDNLSTRTPVQGEPLIHLEKISRALIRNCSAAPGMATFLLLSAAENEQIVLSRNWLENAKHPFILDGARNDAIIEVK